MKDNVWFTFKARIQAAQRLSRSDFHSQALLVWYAFGSASLAIVNLRHSQLLGSDTDLIAAILGVGLLVVSMFVTSQDFRGRSIGMRTNYLALQALYNEIDQATLTPSERAKYNELLAAVENHTEMDDRMFRVFHKGNLTRPPTRYETFEVHAYLALRAAVLTLLYVAPFGLLLLAAA